MNYTKILAWATVALAVLAGLNYLFPIHTELLEKVKDAEIKKILKEKEDKTEISLKKDIYQSKNTWLIEMYNAARKSPYSSSKSDALTKVVNVAISVNDYNLAVIAAKDIPYNQTKSDALMLIVKSAVKNENTLGYAVKAAERIPYNSSKADAIEIIVEAGEKLASSKKVTTGEYDLKGEGIEKSKTAQPSH